MIRILRYVSVALLLWVLFLILCLVVLPAFHKEAGSVVPVEDTLYKNAAPERVRSVDLNRDALLWRLRLIEEAKERIILATFDFWDEESGWDVMSALWNAADRGVKVQILVDGLNGGIPTFGSKNFRQLSSHENVEIRLYNPLNLLTPWTINYRMHDKYLIADDFAYLLGGRNTDDRFLGNYRAKYNVDRDILVYETEPGRGRSYQQLEDYFYQVWNLSCCKVFEKQESNGELEQHYEKVKERYPEVFSGPLTKEEWEAATLEAERVDLWTNPIEPENKAPVLWTRMVEAMSGEKDVLVQTPYIICSKEMYEDLRSLCDGGSQLDILINAVELGSNPFGCTDYLNQKKALRETGVHMYEYLGDQALHTKAILVGDDLTIAGSCNFDMRSVYLDTELMLAIRSPELNTQIRTQLETLKEQSRHMSPDGSIEDGPTYVSVEQTLGKRITYGILRVVTLPFRHLL